MTKVVIAEEVADRIRNSEGPIELVDSHGQTIGVFRQPPTEAEIERARSRASKDGNRLSWAQLAAKVASGELAKVARVHFLEFAYTVHSLGHGIT